MIISAEQNEAPSMYEMEGASSGSATPQPAGDPANLTSRAARRYRGPV